MAIYTWPAVLPQVPQRGFSESIGLNILRTPMDMGPAKQRRRSNRPSTMSVSFLMTTTQVAALENFCFNTIRGTARFDFPHPRIMAPQVLVPGSYPSVLSDDLTSFARSSTATYLDSAGVLQTATINAPRFQDTGLLIEPSRTNLLVNSNVISAGVGTTVTTNAIISPDGTLSMDGLFETATNGEHYALDRSISGVAGTIYCFSTFIKDAPSQNRQYYHRVAGAATAGVQFNPRTKVATSLGGMSYISHGFEELSNNFFRVWVIYSAESTGTVINRHQLLNDRSGLYLGDTSSGLYIWGAQVEVGSEPSSYIPTITSAVTRAADIASTRKFSTTPEVVEVRVVPQQDGELFKVQYTAPTYWTVTLNLEILP